MLHTNDVPTHWKCTKRWHSFSRLGKTGLKFGAYDYWFLLHVHMDELKVLQYIALHNAKYGSF
jgi:hypothetical protein